MTVDGTALGSGTVGSVSRLAADAGLRVVRAWPRGPGRLLLDLREGASPQVLAGQWFADVDQATGVARATARRSGGRAVGVLHGTRSPGALVLQRGGADRRLASLTQIVARPGARLVSHRPERRAVVSEPGEGTAAGTSWTKVVRPDHVAGAVRAARLAAGCGGPPLLAVDPSRGAVTTSGLPGVDLGAALRARPDDAEALGRAVAGAVRRLHAPGRVRDGLPTHGPQQEVSVARAWVQAAAEHGVLAPASVSALLAVLDRVVPAPAHVVTVHRDLHDLQLVVDRDRVAVLDLDLAAHGDAAVDLANLVVHLQWRALQGTVPAPAAAACAGALLAAYRPDRATARHVAAYARTTWARLAAVHAFRPDDRAAVAAALDLAAESAAA